MLDFSSREGYRNALKVSVEIIAQKLEVLELPGKRSLDPFRTSGQMCSIY